jgi:hypothetical protein
MPQGSARSVSAESSPPAASAAKQPSFTQEPRHAFSGAPHAKRSQLEVDPRRPVGLAAVHVDTGVDPLA